MRAIHWVAQSPKETVLRFLSPQLTSMVHIVLLSSARLIGGVGVGAVEIPVGFPNISGIGIMDNRTTV
jgi:hypothetical protein